MSKVHQLGMRKLRFSSACLIFHHKELNYANISVFTTERSNKVFCVYFGKYTLLQNHNLVGDNIM